MAYRLSISITDESVYEYMNELKNNGNLSKDVENTYKQRISQHTQEQNHTLTLQTKQNKGINMIITLFGLAAFFIGITLYTSHPQYLYLGVFFTVEGTIATILGLLGIRDNKKTIKQHYQPDEVTA